MKKEIWLIIILAVVIIVLGAVALWPKEPAGNQGQNNYSGIKVTTPKPNEEIISPLKIIGEVNGNGWAPFEGQAGVVRLVNSQGKELALGILTTPGEWMKLPAAFETTLNFALTEDTDGSLIFRNENASGLPEKDKEFVMPVKIKKSGETMVVKVFFNNSKLDPEASCNKVFGVERTIPKTESTGSASLSELFLGPTQAEKDAGYFTSINEGVGLQVLTIGMDSGIARADFNEQLQAGVGGSCRVSAIRAQITETLKQFPTIKSVVISINGRTEDILQP